MADNILNRVVSHSDWWAYGNVYTLEAAIWHQNAARSDHNNMVTYRDGQVEQGEYPIENDMDDIIYFQRYAAWNALRARYALGLRDHAGDYDYA